MLQIQSLTIGHKASFMAMALLLWPDYDAGELDRIFSGLSPQKSQVLLGLTGNKPIGFVYMSLRTDYVEGSDSSPVGYLEGVFVLPAYRRAGIAAQLLRAGEDWARSHGCTQLGSDVIAANKQGYDFHTRTGFREANRLIAFIKDI